MKKKIVGILFSMMMIIPALATTVTADSEPEVKIEIKGGFGLNYKIINIGDDSIDQSTVWIKFSSKLFFKSYTDIQELNEPLLSGESYSDISFIKGAPIISLYLMFCTITVTFYEVMPGRWPIIGEKSVDALYLFGFVTILSE